MLFRSSAAQQTDAPPTSPETRQSNPTTCSLAVEAVNQPVPLKLGLLTQTEQQPTPPTPAPLPLPPAPPVSPSHATPPVAIPPSSPSLASLFHSLGLNLSLFRPSPSSSMTSLPLSASPSFSSSSVAISLIVQHIQDILNGDICKWQRGSLNGHARGLKRAVSEQGALALHEGGRLGERAFKTAGKWRLVCFFFPKVSLHFIP